MPEPAFCRYRNQPDVYPHHRCVDKFGADVTGDKPCHYELMAAVCDRFGEDAMARYARSHLSVVGGKDRAAL